MTATDCWACRMEEDEMKESAMIGVNANAIIDESDLDMPSATTIVNGVPVVVTAYVKNMAET